MTKSFRVCHIVRRFGCVGGMERYVWELSHSLTRLGIHVEVICEKVYGAPAPEILIHTIEVHESPSRWRAMQRFRIRVDKLIRKNSIDQRAIIHSHERSLNHHVSTFHGPPMNAKTDWWRFSALSPRINAWKAMEKDEVLGSKTQVVLPVSRKILDQLVHRYPKLLEKHLAVAYPGIHEPDHQTGPVVTGKKTTRCFVFVGKEWRRKGLNFAVKIIDHYTSRFGNCTMEVYGPEAAEMPGFIQKHPNLVLKGWSTDIPWNNYDALIHPATVEPFGMVIPEARRHGVPVLTTDIVGSTELRFDGVVALNTAENVGTWVSSLVDLINNDENRISEIKWTWDQLALKHIHEIYPLAKQLEGSEI